MTFRMYDKDKPRVVIDFETRSNTDIARGRKQYFCAPDANADILMMGYLYLDGERKTNKAELWLPGQPLPHFATNPNEYTLIAHNAEFEIDCINEIGTVKYGFAPVDACNFICTMALCGRYGLPQSLAAVGEVLNLRVQKDTEGRGLIELFCTPKYSFGRVDSGKISVRYAEQWMRFCEYCLRDVEAEAALLQALPHSWLSESEYWAWWHTCQLNARGIPYDVESVHKIRLVAEAYREAHFELLPEMTGGEITKITQTQRIVKYVNRALRETEAVKMLYRQVKLGQEDKLEEILKEQLILMPNCRVDTIVKMLDREDLPDNVRLLIEMRAQLGLSSIGKYIRFEEMGYNGRVYDNQRYYGAHTGRWTGNGVQLYNLPRASVEDPEAEIAKFFDGSIVNDNPVKSARALIRSMIKAPPGKMLVAADYSSIEYVVLEWFACDTAKLERFEQGYDQYIDQASAMYNVPYEAVTKEQRRQGKVVVLGCGYGQGANRLVVTADAQFGLNITFEESDFMVRGYRTAHNKVVKMWYDMKDTIVLAIQNPGLTFTMNMVQVKVARDRNRRPWLTLTLPSGRVLYYSTPSLEEDAFGLSPVHMGFHQTTRQWVKQRLIPGRIVENIVQAAARDILVDGMKAIEREMGPVILWSVYDEIIAEVDDLGDAGNAETLERFCKAMCTVGDWARNIPIRADGFIGKRYKKM